MKYAKINLDGLNVFYRESEDTSKPDFLLLHGFPTSSAMFRNLMPLLAAHFHVIAPDLIGFGQSDAPLTTDFTYTFDHLTEYVQKFITAMHLDTFYLYVFDYGAPIGFRIAAAHPDKILGIVSQNGNVYQAGLGPKWAKRAEYWANPTPAVRQKLTSAFAPATIIGQYTNGEKPGSISPDGYSLDIYYTHSNDYSNRQSDLIYDYQTNVALYPQFQAYLRQYQPQLLAAWGKNDPSFIPAGAESFKNDDSNSEIHLLDAGHFALESQYQTIAKMIIDMFA
ncbi:alpha beta fold family hydrolase [Lactobacillus selangorensis]|uniref:Alpha beta fold family hydrolase n=1 Tax=Lactobacillus selangorensis TaxID=81857 RepID=A0A0R2FSK7_9LACO|nr:alpha/beta hydrolase [Lactobacillus selangorensis]KRN28092.1 alpha beta fold family hydrolase [Lactobacillus selangorensis]KRN31030.1 alpha beta fold family hydrolase [Lactobacillus selangorensis]